MKTTRDMNQNRVYFTITTLILFFILAGHLFAQQEDQLSTTDSSSNQKEFNQAINFCPGGIIFGIYAINYEYLIGQKHGLVPRFDYESVSETLSNDTMEAIGYAFTFNYRWHFSRSMNSFYVGSYVRYKLYEGNATDGATKFDFTLHEYTIGLNAGKRWVWNSGININCAFGYGISQLNKETEPTSPSNDAKLDEFIDEYTFIGPFYGEISIGYAF
jgi:hypothetical protein